MPPATFFVHSLSCWFCPIAPSKYTKYVFGRNRTAQQENLRTRYRKVCLQSQSNVSTKNLCVRDAKDMSTAANPRLSEKSTTHDSVAFGRNRNVSAKNLCVRDAKDMSEATKSRLSEKSIAHGSTIFGRNQTAQQENLRTIALPWRWGSIILSTILRCHCEAP